MLAFDFRVGGAYRFAYQVPDGPLMIVNGLYRSIAPPTGLSFSWNIEPPDEHAGLQSEVTVSIAPTAKGSELYISHRQLTLPGSIARHRDDCYRRDRAPRLPCSKVTRKGNRNDAIWSPGVLAYLVPTFILGFVWHLVLFKSYYEALAMYRSDVIIPLGLLSMAVQSAIFAWLYTKTFAALRMIASWSRALAYGVIGRRAVLEFHDACGWRQERDGVSA